ncbi:MAG: hypothetical protein KME32_26645 [Mojavia pulchra JT2-VF2]|jgi:hypothetical protein|uniref:Uncharacterized protein n=1 Tax=Mojavia pulchra JT2-VF2 TaxID=287848 RepID=A0A951Q2P3_9NOST|nr:hypothetical protein [Mojavia pulchra JT2-VF2]
MSATYQKLLHSWATLAPDECQTTNHDFKFKVRILPAVEKCESTDAWRLITTENFAWRLENGQGFTLQQLNFILLTIINHCAARHSSIGFTFGEQGATAVICNGLKSQPHPHPAMSATSRLRVYAALDAYIQLLEF